MRVRWSERARTQLADIVEYIARERPATAEQLLDGLLERVSLLALFPAQGSVWGRGSRSDVHSIVYESYRIVYRIAAEEVAVLSVRHTRLGSGPEPHP